MLLKKNKIANAISLVAFDIVSDKEIAVISEKFCSNDNSASWLCTEIMIQKINALAFIVWSKYGKEYNWASLNFFTENILKGISTSKQPKELSSVILKGFKRLQSIEGEGKERLFNVYNSSADLVLKHEPTLNRNELIKIIDTQIELFIKGLGEYFD